MDEVTESLSDEGRAEFISEMIAALVEAKDQDDLASAHKAEGTTSEDAVVAVIFLTVTS